MKPSTHISPKPRRSGLSGFIILALLIAGTCQAGQAWETPSNPFRKIVLAVPVIAIVSPELPELENQDLEEDPDSLPPMLFR